MRMMNYILDDDHNPVPCDDIIAWGKWFESGVDRRRVDMTIMPDGSAVSTVFLGIDHRFFGDGPPLLFETMIFSPPPKDTNGMGEAQDYQERCCTWAEAEKQHADAVAHCYRQLNSLNAGTSLTDNLEQIANEMRDELAKGFGCFYSIREPGLESPIDVEVIPDGVTWICVVQCGTRKVFDSSVDPKEFVSSLYVFLRYVIKTLKSEPPKSN